MPTGSPWSPSTRPSSSATAEGGSADVPPLYRALFEPVPDTTAQRIVLGRWWTMVVAAGSAGLAHAAEHPGDPLAGPAYAGRSLAALTRLIDSADIRERSLAMAAANAHWNRPGLAGGSSNGLDLAAARPGRCVVVGRFPGLDERLPGAAVIERQPGPRDYPESAAPRLLAACDTLVVTASTLANGTLPGLLALAPRAWVVMVGPGTPLAPPLFGHGLHCLSGMVIEDADGAAAIVAAGGSVKALKAVARYVTLTA